jgi:hypothetical protein
MGTWLASPAWDAANSCRSRRHIVVGDNIDIREREKLAREGKRMFVGAVAGASGLIAVPALIGAVLWGPVAAFALALAGLYLGGQWIATGVEAGYAKGRRYGRQAMLPGARLVLHDGGVAYRDRIGPLPEQQDAGLADEEQRAGDEDRAAEPACDIER